MSKFSGKCDLYDHIGMEKMTPHLTNPNILVSDELECFEIFKKKTGGVIYQFVPIKLTKRNINYFLDKSDNLTYDGKKYFYLDGSYTSLDQLNKRGYYFKKKIRFETLLDIIPYYPYLVTISSSGPEGSYIVISERSIPEIRERECYDVGFDCESLDWYKSELQQHYIEVVKKYNL